MELERGGTGGWVTPLSQTVRLECGAKNACTYIPADFDYDNEDGFDDDNGDNDDDDDNDDLGPRGLFPP